MKTIKFFLIGVALLLSLQAVSAYCDWKQTDCCKYPAPSNQPSIYQRHFAPTIGETASPYRRSFQPTIGETVSPYRRSFASTVGQTASPYTRNFAPSTLGERTDYYKKSFCVSCRRW
jgi:hypothetical protein